MGWDSREKAIGIERSIPMALFKRMLGGFFYFSHDRSIIFPQVMHQAINHRGNLKIRISRRIEPSVRVDRDESSTPMFVGHI